HTSAHPLVSSLPPPPPTPPLFPYTTLFRSCCSPDTPRPDPRSNRRRTVRAGTRPSAARFVEFRRRHSPRSGVHNGDASCSRQILDRKSTRLNSSHSQISYAVFCLKKKKIKN